MPSSFSTALLQWFETEKRDLPWKNTRDAYKIWISEIILQQTRVAQGLPYYQRFITRFPNVKKLADAPLDDVLKLWEGLGYYSRARNLHHTAQVIRDAYGGKFPDTYEEVLGLKGVGTYTAAAIMSFAYDQPFPVLDGNVKRVAARYHCIREPADLPATQKQMMSWLNTVMPADKAADFNQALLDLGATVCTPQNPICDACPVAADCAAKREGLQDLLPVKSKQLLKKDRFFHFFVLLSPDDKCVIQQRKDKDIWQGLYQFPLMETLRDQKLTQIEIAAFFGQLGLSPDIISEISILESEKPHILTHQSIYTKYYIVKINTEIILIPNDHIFLVDTGKLSNFAFPRVLHGVLSNITI